MNHFLLFARFVLIVDSAASRLWIEWNGKGKMERGKITFPQANMKQKTRETPCEKKRNHTKMYTGEKFSFRVLVSVVCSGVAHSLPCHRHCVVDNFVSFHLTLYTVDSRERCEIAMVLCTRNCVTS